MSNGNCTCIIRTGSAIPFIATRPRSNRGHPVDGAGKVRRCLTDQHLARLRYSAQPGRQIERAAAEPGLDRDRLTDVDSHADQQRQRRVRPHLPREPLLELDRRTDRRTWRGEHAQRLITAELDQLTAALSHDLADEPGEALRQSGRSLVAVRLRKRGVAAETSAIRNARIASGEERSSTAPILRPLTPGGWIL